MIICIASDQSNSWKGFFWVDAENTPVRELLNKNCSNLITTTETQF
jgi:hypothetical protein